MGPKGRALAAGLLDGRAFEGMIGPAEAPDLEDRLYFDDGHFWSDACTRCGFVPGKYEARSTDDGVAFSGVLESESRGRFEYRGTVTPDGEIEVAINWEKKRWYWTSRREIAFVGTPIDASGEFQLEGVLKRMNRHDPEENPACSRF